MTFRAALPFTLVALFALPASAQDASRPYDDGSVWQIRAVQTKPGHFEDYMKFVAVTWRAQMEELKKRGQILGYKVLTNQSPRDNEPDVYLMVEYKNMAAFDAPPGATDPAAKAVYGSVAAQDQAAANREAIRTMRGVITTRELKLRPGVPS